MFGIWLQTGCVCLCNWNISLLLRSYFCSWELQLFKCLPCYRSVCANQLYISRKLWVEGNLSIINQWWKPQKGGGKFLNFSGGKQKGGDTIFDLNLVGGGGTWRKLWATIILHCLWSTLHHELIFLWRQHLREGS